MELQKHRKEHPRSILESPGRYKLWSRNYDLLCVLDSRLDAAKRPALMQHILRRLQTPPASAPNRTDFHSVWLSLSSELPLTVEFVVRHGSKAEFLHLLGELEVLPANIFVLKQLEEIICLDFRTFTAGEYLILSVAVDQITQKARAARQTDGLRVAKTQLPVHRELYEVKYFFDGIIATAKNVKEQCRKAGYLLLRAELEHGLNLEVNQDKQVIESYLSRSGFSPPLVEALNHVEQLYTSRASGFDLKGCIGQLRSFLENLIKGVIPTVEAKFGDSAGHTWGMHLNYLFKRGVLSKAEEEFAAAFYRLMSDEAVHPLFAEQEYARLARNMTIEFGLLFLRKLEKMNLLPAKPGHSTGQITS